MLIKNGRDSPLVNGSPQALPNVGSAMRGLFRPLTVTTVAKAVDGSFQVKETPTTVNFQGVVQPLTERQLQLKPQGQRAWTWLWMHADPSLVLEVDDVVTFLGVQTRVMSRKDWQAFGYVEYHLCQDWTGVGP